MSAYLTEENIQLTDWLRGNDEQVKSAAAAATKATRTTIKEESFQPVIMPFMDVTNDDLDYNSDSEISGKWFELEADTRGARIVPYNTSPITVNYRAEKYLVIISQMITPEYAKNVNELRGYKTDVQAMIQDSMLRDLHTMQDTFLINTVDRTVGERVLLGSPGWTTESQHVEIDAGFNRDSVSRIDSFMVERTLPDHLHLCNARTLKEYLAWKHDEVGGPDAQGVLRKGFKYHEKLEFFGANWVPTIKRTLVTNGTIYTFTHPDYLGKACMLEDIKVTIKKDWDIIRMRADQQTGLTFSVSRGLQKTVLTGMRA